MLTITKGTDGIYQVKKMYFGKIEKEIYFTGAQKECIKFICINR